MRATLDAFGDSVTDGNVARMYDTTAELRSEAPAIETRDRRVSHAELRTATRTFAAAEIREFSIDHIAAYKHPREVAFIAELPRIASGEIRKFELGERAS